MWKGNKVVLKKIYLFLFIIITVIFEIFFTIKCINNETYYKNDVIKINELVKEIELNYEDTNKYPKNLEYCVLDENENLIFRTSDDLNNSLIEAYRNKDTIVDFSYDNDKGKIIIYNDFEKIFIEHKKIYLEVIIIIASIQIITFIIYYIYLYKNIIKPFKKMKDFALRISSGNLDIPLEMDKNNNFGAFTEAFDVMRNEIKKSREAEKKANEAKKELVAKLSHDIKTPIASIKSYSELGSAVSNDEKAKEYFKSIDNKSDQMSVLITNLFNSTLEELEELKINSQELNSSVIKTLIENSDYLQKRENFEIPKEVVYADKLRLQQVFDNIFSNSYKYANTKIEINSYTQKEYLVISIRDFGENVKKEEITLYTEKFKRGSNTKNIDGSGLGLYISKQLLEKMNGNLEIENAEPGFKVIIYLRII